MVFADVPDLREGKFGLWDLNIGYLLTGIEAGQDTWPRRSFRN